MRNLYRILPIAALALSPCALFAGDLEKGMEAFNVGDYETSLAECQPLADEGNAAAQFCVGRLYANGFGVDMNDEKALHWYGAAADQGHPEAQYNLGVMNANGWGVEMNDDKAADYYRQAAVQGFVPAVMSLAEICHRGMGVKEDVVDAYAWYIVAAQLGNMDAELRRDAAAEDLMPEEQATGQQMAEERLEAIDVDSIRAGNID